MTIPKVSIIVPNYNHAKYLNKRLDSIFNQTYQDFEVILLDDCSSDSSLSILNEYSSHPRVSHFIRNQANSGTPFVQWEKGIELAEGEYIWIAESDDWSDCRFLEKLVPIMSDDRVGLVYSDSYWIDDEDRIKESKSHLSQSFRSSGIDMLRKEMCNRCTIQNVSAVLWKSSFIKKCPTHFSDFKHCIDWLFYVEMLLIPVDIVFLGEKLNYFRWYHNSFSQKAAKQGSWIIEGIRILDLISQNVQFSIREVLTTSKIWIRKLLIYFLITKNFSKTYRGLVIIISFFFTQLFPSTDKV